MSVPRVNCVLCSFQGQSQALPREPSVSTNQITQVCAHTDMKKNTWWQRWMLRKVCGCSHTYLNLLSFHSACVFACVMSMFISFSDLPGHPGLTEDTLNFLLYCYHIYISNQSIVVYVPFLSQHSFLVTYTKSSRILEGTLCISTSWFQPLLLLKFK